MNRQQFMHRLEEVSSRHRDRLPSQTVLENNFIDFPAEEKERDQDLNNLLRDLRSTSLPFV